MESLINVCTITEEGRYGGPASRIIQIANTLNSSDFNIKTHVVFPSLDSDRFAYELSKKNIPCSSINITRLSKKKNILFKYISRFFFEIFILFSFFKKHNFDLVQVNGSQQFKGAIAAKMAGIPIIWLLEDALMSKVVKIICRGLAKLTASGIIVVGENVYDYYIKGTSLEKKTVALIPPPVDTSIFNKTNADKNQVLSKFKGLKIITVSSIYPVKGLEYFLKMASKTVLKYPDICFFIAAPNLDSQKKYFQKLMRIVELSNLDDKNCKFLGSVRDIPSFLNSGDIFVYTSISETGPMAVWEAMAMELPIITTDVGAVSKYLKNEENAFIVQPKNIDALTEKLVILIEDRNLRKRMGSSAQSIAKEKLNVLIAAKKYANFYRQIANNN